jgi:alkyl hydroperoxide reductase subunit AhpC
MLTVGDRLPELDLRAAVSLDRGREFTQISDKSYPGQWLVLFSWPMDFTCVAPTEIAELGKRNEEFRERDAQVLGMSTDTRPRSASFTGARACRCAGRGPARAGRAANRRALPLQRKTGEPTLQVA